MALITDPDLLAQGVEVTINTSLKTIALSIAGDLSTDGVTLKALYSFLKEEWKNDTDLIKHPFPMTPITDEQFELVKGWDFADSTTRNLIRTAGWAVVNTSGVVTGMWTGIITLGSLESDDQVYYQQATGGSATNVVLTGPVNQAVQVYSDPNGDGSTADGYDRRDILNLFVREWQQTYAAATLTDIGVSAVTYQAYRFPLASGADLKVTRSEVTVAADPVTITYYGTDQNKTIGAGTYPYRVVINAAGKSLERVYESVQYQLRQNSDIDAGAGTVTGKTAAALLAFVGDNLVTEDGVFVENFDVSDTNRLTQTDKNGVARNYPFVASLTVNFGDNLVDDADAIYRVFVTSGYGTAGATTVLDADDVAMAGSVSGQPSITHTYDYDALGSDLAITAVAIGLSTGQFVTATTTITRSTSNVVSLVAALERNYQNP